jgi:hypothetical protein
MPDLLDEQFSADPTGPKPRRVVRREKREAKALAKATKQLEQRQRVQSTIRNPPPTRGLVITGLLFAAVIVGAAFVPGWLSAASAPEPTAKPTATPAPTVTEDPAMTAEQTARAWTYAYFDGGDWESLTVPASVDQLDATRTSVYFAEGSPLEPSQKVGDVQVLPASEEAQEGTWTRTVNVRFTGQDDAPVVAAFVLSLVDEQGWKISSLTPTFLGQA